MKVQTNGECFNRAHNIANSIIKTKSCRIHLANNLIKLERKKFG